MSAATDHPELIEECEECGTSVDANEPNHFKSVDDRFWCGECGVEKLANLLEDLRFKKHTEVLSAAGEQALDERIRDTQAELNSLHAAVESNDTSADTADHRCACCRAPIADTRPSIVSEDATAVCPECEDQASLEGETWTGERATPGGDST